MIHLLTLIITQTNAVYQSSILSVSGINLFLLLILRIFISCPEYSIRLKKKRRTMEVEIL